MLVLVSVPSHTEAHVEELLLLFGKAFRSLRILLDLLFNLHGRVLSSLVDSQDSLELFLSLDRGLLLADERLPGPFPLGAGHLDFLVAADLEQRSTSLSSVVFLLNADLGLILGLLLNYLLF